MARFIDGDVMLQTTHAPAFARVLPAAAHATLCPPEKSAFVDSGLQLSVSHDLAALENDWRNFELQADGTAFQCFDWLATWQKHVGRLTGATPVIVTGRSGPNLAFILPLAVGSWLGLRRLTFLGRDLCDYNAPLLAPDFTAQFGAQFAKLWRRIGALLQQDARTRHDLVLLDRMPAEVGMQPNPLAALAVLVHPSGAYRMPMAGEWETFYAAKRSSATRRRDRTKRKRLAESGAVDMATAATSADTERTLAALISQKRRSFARMGVADIFAQPGHLAFYRDMAGNPQAHPIVHMSSLDVGSTIAAANFGLKFRGVYYHVLASYDDGPLSKFGPGATHLHELMRYALQHGCNTFDFTIGDEPYKRDWCEAETTLYDHLAATSTRGAAAVAIMRATLAGKRAIKHSSLWPTLIKVRAAIGAARPRPSPQHSASEREDGA
jgi:CelD/BcsL family acetyltransferase involved in cellulose biosynthesis